MKDISWASGHQVDPPDDFTLWAAEVDAARQPSADLRACDHWRWTVGDLVQRFFAYSADLGVI